MTMAGQEHIPVRVTGRSEVGQGIVQLSLCPVEGAGLPEWQPGAHVDLVLPLKDEAGAPVVRPYSLCGDVADRFSYRLGILRDPAGRGGSAFVHDNLKVGDVIAVSAPRNYFPFSASGKILFIAGGIGITPILPMVSKAVTEGLDWQLIVAARNRARLPFPHELAALPQERIRFHCDDEAGILDLKTLLAPLGAGTTVYSCGPAPLLDALQAFNEGAPWQLKIERFAAAKRPELEVDRPFEVICRTSGKRLHVPSDKSLLEVLREAGIKVDSSCREGVCGTCETRVLSGTPCHRDSVLSEDERAEGDYMMVCVSRAKGDLLELDI
jgi:ferredoxin-NADP reductase